MNLLMMLPEAADSLGAYHKMVSEGGDPANVGAFMFLMPPAKSGIHSIKGDVGMISITGTLHNEEDPYYYGTSYKAIASAIASLEANDKVNSIEFEIDSPGGYTRGLFELLDVMSAMQKPTRAIVSGTAASAAYAVASATGEIVATSKAAAFGSIGTVVSMYKSDYVVNISNTDSPKKAPDVKTEEGKSAVREYLDQVNSLFVDEIAKGRGVTAETIKNEYGQGGVFVSGEALKRKMIDKIDDSALSIANGGESAKLKTDKVTASNGEKQEVTKVDIDKLKSEHPDVYRQAIAVGAKQERDRVSAHLIYGEKMGAMDIAVGAIKSGDEVTEALRAEYLTAGMNKQAITAMAKDTTSAEVKGKESAVSDKEKAQEEFETKAAEQMFAELGLNMEA